MDIERIVMYEGASRTAHFHAGYEFRYIVSGHCSVVMRGERRELSTGSAFITAPYESHTIVYDDTIPLVQYLVLFTLAPGENELRAYIESLIAQRILPLGEGKRHFFETVRMKVSARTRANVLSGIHQFISFLFGLSEGQPRAAESSEPRIEQALAELHRSLTERIDVVSLARRVGLDRSYFIRIFKKTTGLAPMKYLQRLKVEAACGLLVRTDMPITDIAERFRFADQYHFSRMFKRQMGVSPLYYRRRGGDVV